MFRVLGDVASAGGLLREVMRAGDRRRGHRQQAGRSDATVFPVPMLQRSDVPRRGRGHARAIGRRPLHAAANLVLAVLNLLQAGHGESAVNLLPPTAAQKRVQFIVMDGIRSFLRGAGGASGKAEVVQYLREEHGYAGGAEQVALAMGRKAGVPAAAGAVDLSAALAPFVPEMSKQVRNPRSILLRPRDRRRGRMCGLRPPTGSSSRDAPTRRL